MATETIVGPAKRLAIFHRDDGDGAIAAAASVTTQVRADGLHRVKGHFHSDQAPASGYPRVRQGVNGSDWSILDVIARDRGLSGFQYRFNLAIRENYVSVEWTQGSAQGSWLRAMCFVQAGGEGQPDDEVGSVASQLQIIRSDKDTHFTTAIALDNHEAENLTGLNSNVGVVESVTLLAEDNIDWRVHFWSTDGFDNADLDTDAWLGSVDFSAVDGVQLPALVSTTFRYSKSGLALPYVDDDGTNELHVSLEAIGVAKTAGATGEVALLVGFRAES